MPKPFPRPAAPAKREKKAPSPAVRIVGLGSSAGGLEALDAFLRHVPARCGLAFVIVQHLDPTRKDLMPGLLQRATAMKVIQARNHQKVTANRVYVIPPDKDMSILHGVLHLFTPKEGRGLRLPIDFFFRSLALDQHEGSIGVILSGMGSDGTLGLRAIKETAGLSLVQKPDSAKFDSMPRSAIDAGLADIVAPVEELPERILAYLRRSPTQNSPAVQLEGKSRGTLEKAVILLRAQTGHDFSLYKRNTLCRRIERRMAIHQIASPTVYVSYLRNNPGELDLLFKEFLIGVTHFFRDPATWEHWRTEAIPALIAARPANYPLRAWVAGCSTGEEAYSLAMVFKEALDRVPTQGRPTLQIFATDLDPDAINKARTGTFSANISADVSPERLQRFFTKDTSGYRLRSEIREMVIFAPQNLVMDPPFTRLDILSCRNLLIYLGPEVQKKLITLFHYSLNPDGLLFLGSAESIGTTPNLFATFDAKSRLYRRLHSASGSEPVIFPSGFHSPPSGPGAPALGMAPTKPVASLQSLADQVVLQSYAPPAVLVNERGDICYFSGRTGKYLEPAAGKANWNLFAMAREDLRYELTSAFQQLLRHKKPVELHALRLQTESGQQSVNITLQPFVETGPLHGLVLIVFTAVAVLNPGDGDNQSVGRDTAAPSRQPRLAELEAELQQVRNEARAGTKEMQTSHEELRSANEELQSTIEELQSTNEELTTSQEEMQSLNEELQTLNAEQQAKLDQLSDASNDMKNLLDSTAIATLFLDPNLNVRRFTPQAVNIINLIPGDVGRPITDLVSALNYPTLAKDVRSVLAKLEPTEQAAATKDGRWFNVRVMPYRTMDDRVDGVVITFADITAAKTIETQLRGRHAVLEKLVNKQTNKLAGQRRKSTP